MGTACHVPPVVMGTDRSFRPLRLETGFTIVVGCLRRPVLIDTKVHISGTTFVKLDKNGDWLSKAICGERANTRSLSRTTIIEDVKQMLQTSCDAVAHTPPDDDPMLGLDYDDDTAIHGSGLSPQKVRKRRRHVDPDKVVTLTVRKHCKETHPDNADTQTITVLANGKALWLSLADLDWFIEYVHGQYVTGCVPRVPKQLDPHGSGESEQTWWNHRDSAWCCRVKGNDGTFYTKSMGVKTRQTKVNIRPGEEPQTDVSYESRKAAVYQELSEWKQQVQNDGAQLIN